MPEIIYGRNHSSRTELLFDRIRAAAQCGEALVIIPDQYSFEFDKLLYTALGAKLFNSVQTMGVSRLCEQICRTFGGRKLENADENLKLIAMYKAQAKLRSSGKLVFYKKSLLRPSFVSQCIELVPQLIRAGATPETLSAAAERTVIGAAKLRDLSLIFAEYAEALEQMGVRDSLSQTAQAAALAKEGKYFSGKQVFFDAFTSFSADELSLVESVIGNSKSCTFSIVYDECGNGQNPFAETQRTVQRIERISQDCNLKVKMTHAADVRQSEPMLHINGELYKYEIEKLDSEGKVKAVQAADIYEESEYVCAQICNLVRGGAKYNEIAVICGGLSATAQVLGGVAERYGIPYYVDLKKSALTSVPAKYLMSVLDAALTREYRTENILRVAKSPLSPVLEYDARDLEEFCIKWGVEGNIWRSPFEPCIGEDDESPVEKTRKRLIEPLDKFRSACRGASAGAGEICRALFTLLDELEMSEQVYSTVRRASSGNETELEISRGFKQVWLGIVGAIRTVYEYMRDEKISLRAFSELLRLMLDGIKISAPPQKADCVRIADADRSRVSGVKTLFIMQTNDGIFPRGASRGGLLGENEAAALADLGAELECSVRNMLDSERMSTYMSVTAPSESLYVTYSAADRTGAAAAPSALVGMIRALFSDDIFLLAADCGQEFFCTSYRTAFYSWLEHSKDKTQVNSDIRRSVERSSEFKLRLEAAETAAKGRVDSISRDTAKKLFFPGNVTLSATRVSDYYKCPYFYFCKHGLKLYAPKAVEINPLFTGTIVHSCLERVMSNEKDGKRVYNPEFTKLTDGELAKLIDRQTEEYIQSEMGGEFAKNQSFRCAVERLKKSTLGIAANFRDEMKKSLFIPVAFEYDLTDENGEPVFCVELDDSTTIAVVGKVDRADVYLDGDKAWLRIVDYKTGKQKFKEAEVYHGLDLQMLIYMLALSSEKSTLVGDNPHHAGITYSHLRFVKPSLNSEEVQAFEEKGELDGKLKIERAKAYKPDGMALGEEIFPALNKDYEGVYTVFRFTSKGTLHGSSAVKPVSEEYFKAMEQFALLKLKDMAEKLADGKIASDPIVTVVDNEDKIHCTNCDYRAMCSNPLPKNPRRVNYQTDGGLLSEELEKIMKKEENGNGGRVD